MNKDRLEQLMLEEVADHYIAGVQVAVYENGEEIFYHSCGVADREKNLPLKKNTIMRLYSMTKPVTAVAANILRERGMLDFERPVSDYLPEYTRMKVLYQEKAVPAEQPILVKHLLSMTSGIVYPDFDSCGQMMEEVFDGIHGKIEVGNADSTREVIKKIAEVPLCFEPGTSWRYGLSVDVLGAIIEVVSGMKFSEFLKKEIFDPLEMYDTAFYVPEDKQHRFAQLYKRTEKGVLEIDQDRHLGLTLCLEPPAYEAGGAGLLSTLTDYSKFARMLANKGSWNGVKILSEETVAAFMENTVSLQYLEENGFWQLKGYGYGNCMRINLGTGKSLSKESAGEFGWDGWTGPYVSVDAIQNRVILVMQQVSGFDHWDFIWEIRNAVLC